MSTPSSTHLDDVPLRLIQTAIELYGSRGTSAVSAREIQREAGVANEAAIRYYFKDKAGLLDACMAQLSLAYEPLINEAWASLEPRRSNGELKVADVISALVFSFFGLSQSNPAGVQLIARMIREQGADGQDLLLTHFGRVVWMLEDAIGELLPNKSPSALRLHVFLAINSTVNGMVDQSILWRLPDTQNASNLFHLPTEALAQGFIDFLAAGISAPSSI